MLPYEIASQTVIRLRGTGSTDAYNNETTGWTSPGSLAISGCSVQPVPGEEVLLGRDAVVSRWKWFGPPDADVLSTDRIRHDGDDYEVDGSVQKWTDPTGSGLDHKVALLRLVEG